MRAYREFAAPPGLREHIACVWTSHDRAVRVLPDGCVDLVLDDRRLVVAGPATAVAVASATPGRDRCGVRLRIASAGAVLGIPAAELRDRSVPLADLWGRSGRVLTARVAAAPDARRAVVELLRGLAERIPAPGGGDPLARQAVLALLRGVRLGEVSRHAGVGERQLRRRFDHAVGYGPATLRRVQRFQRFLDLADRLPAEPLARLAYESGYADQAHLTRECRRLSGLAPIALLAGAPIPAGEKSVPFKP